MPDVVSEEEMSMKYEAEKGSELWTLWADLFIFWRDFGNCQTDEDWQQFHDAAVALERKYKGEWHDLCLAVLLTLSDVAENRWKNAKQRSSENSESNIEF